MDPNSTPNIGTINNEPNEDKPIEFATSKQIESLKKCIEEKMQSYRSRRTRNKIGAITVQVATVLFSVGTTVLIGWKLSVSKDPNVTANNVEITTGLTNGALILSAFVAGISTIDKFFDYKILWVGYNISIAQLNSCVAKLNYLASFEENKVKKEEIDEVFNRFERICSEMNNNYRDTRNAKDS